MKKRVLIAICMAATLLTFSACSSKKETDEKSIQFRNYKWGASESDVVTSEITEGMKEYRDYDTEKKGSYSCLTIKNISLGGYTAEAGYMFVNGVLEAGAYDIDLNEQSAYDDIVKKYTEKYGKPLFTKESTGWGPCAMWVDKETNFIFLSDIMGIVYVEGGSSAVDFFADKISKFHEVDIKTELGKIGNSDGI